MAAHYEHEHPIHLPLGSAPGLARADLTAIGSRGEHTVDTLAGFDLDLANPVDAGGAGDGAVSLRVVELAMS